jgi:preprotein translocase subunit SecB
MCLNYITKDVAEKNEQQSSVDTQDNTKKEVVPLIKCEVSIVGMFSAEQGRFSKDIEDKLVKIQIPAILMPYVRATITSLLAHAGFGSVIFPLINIHEVARQAVAAADIQLID